MVLSPTKDPKRNRKPWMDRQQHQEQQGSWLAPELFLENLGNTENGFASSKLESVLQNSDLQNRQRSETVASNKGAIHDESRCHDREQELDGVEDKGKELEQPTTNAVVDLSNIGGSELGEEEHENGDAPKLRNQDDDLPDSSEVREVREEVVSSSTTPSFREESAGSRQGFEETTLGQGKDQTPEKRNAVAVQGSLMEEDATTTSATLSPPPLPGGGELELDHNYKEDLIGTLSPRRKDRILRPASQDFDEGEDADVAPLPFSGPISLSGYSGPISGGSISRRSDGSSTSTRSFAFPILPFEWNASPARMPPPANRGSYWRNKRDWCLRCLCCSRPSTHP
ncbi:hypothetical protein SELMODRAFT_422973 [Selaginella moellendorffii]|uniref:Uncharacterized protein n=1 Tax=Selaginella moellendorffii TaxID=88036 RepID=D8SK57_SELML|nr:uncharacterized protein LOC9644155 [Selaginella moellendorffii]XP_024544541.1 uncharacterized protein LOC9644155 [Selaginella moellendorffii]EFJ15277.1 hypothetical protein SELMODRAFT_422973 [Selaginella moellendorffii]|eukprot:XP_002983781.1 uncharacterized protein LOC9644155 [Selaginella moellendorffii]